MAGGVEKLSLVRRGTGGQPRWLRGAKGGAGLVGRFIVVGRIGQGCDGRKRLE